jgi:ABC-2 type transport system ATP-binding protein
VLLLDGLTKRFGDLTALDGCRLAVARGQMLGFLGPNGAGKTTAMRTVFGLVVPDRGEVSWDAMPIGLAARMRFGYMPEERGLYPRMTVIDQVVYFGRLHGLSRTDALASGTRLLAEFGLGDRLQAKVDQLSHGNQQRVQLAVAMVHDPELLVLDEPFSGLDPVAASLLADVLRARAESGTAVLFSSHQLDLVEDLCEEVVILHRGQVVAEGLVGDLRSALPRRYLDITIRDSGGVWADGMPVGRIVERMGDRVRFVIEGPFDLEQLAVAASRVGEVVEFSLRPPDLSEVFTEVAGR